jgi:hypothetical protein
MIMVAAHLFFLVYSLQDFRVYSLARLRANGSVLVTVKDRSYSAGEPKVLCGVLVMGSPASREILTLTICVAVWVAF